MCIAVLALFSLALTGPAVAAQEATPPAAMSRLSALGYPELRVTVTDDAIEAPAGLTLLTVQNDSSEGTGVFLIGPPPGLSIDEFRATAEASPTPEDEFPRWLYDAVLTGGPSVLPGEQGVTVVDLSAGEWAVSSEGDQEPVTLTVSEGGTPAVSTEPAADLTVELKEYAFSIPEQVASGPQIWELDNTGEQPHIMFVVKTPKLLTMDQVMTLLQLPENATPPAGVPNPEEFEDIGGLTLISSGRTAWLELDLAPGNYLAICFIPDKENGAPHAMLGMVSSFTAE